MTKDRLISAMSNFCPSIIGECPKCGEPIFKGWCCFGCGFDASDKKVKNPFSFKKPKRLNLQLYFPIFNLPSIITL